MHLILQSRYSLWTKKMCHNLWCTSYQPQRAVLHPLLIKLFYFYILFYPHLSMNTAPHHPHPHQQLFLLSQFFMMATHHQIFCFYFHIFLFSYYFLLFHFYFQDTFCCQVCGHTCHISCTVVYTACCMHPKLFLFLLFPLFHFFLYQWFNFLRIVLIVKALSQVTVRWFSSTSRITLYSLGKLFKMWIIKSLSDMLTFWLNSFIQILSPSKWEIHLLRSLSINFYLLLWNSLFNLSRDEAVCRAYILTSLSHATLQFPSRKSSLFAFFTNPNATFPMEELALINKIKSS